MGTISFALTRLLARPWSTVAVGALAALALAPAAGASTPHPPRYWLHITEGETTQPKEGVAGVWAGAEHAGGALERVRLVRGGVVIDEGEGRESASLSELPEVGDYVVVESPLNASVGSVAYDGLPSLDPTVCAGSTNFSGQRSGADIVAGSYYSLVPNTGPYGEITSGYHSTAAGQAQVTLLSGSTFGGSFLAPLALGETVAAEESIEVPLGEGKVFTYVSENVRAVGSCPAPPAPPPPPPPPVIPSLRASIAKIVSATVKLVLGHGFKDVVYVNQAGTVTQDLYLADGAVPAYASSVRHHEPKATLLARGAAKAVKAGDVAVVLHLLAHERRRLHASHSTHAVLVTMVRSTTGVKLNLPRRSVLLRP